MPYPSGFAQHIQHLFASKVSSFSRQLFLECELTTRCHNDCSYCGADIFGEPGEVAFDTLCDYLTRYAQHARQSDQLLLVSLVGGDPVLYSRFDEVLDFLAARRIAFFVKGNASTLTGQRLQKLKETGCLGVKLTCYGEADMHNAHRGLDTFDRLLSCTQAARAVGLSVAWHLSVGKENLESMQRLLPSLAALDLDGISEGRVGRLGKLVEDDHFVDMTPAEWRGFLMALLDTYARDAGSGFRLGFRDKLWVPLLVEEGLLDLAPFRDETIRLGCDLFGSLATIDYRGYLKGCGLIESVQKQVAFRPKKPDSIYLSRERARLEPDSVCGRCSFVPFCRGCRAMALAHTGDPHGQDPHCWLHRDTAPVAALTH